MIIIYSSAAPMDLYIYVYGVAHFAAYYVDKLPQSINKADLCLVLPSAVLKVSHQDLNSSPVVLEVLIE